MGKWPEVACVCSDRMVLWEPPSGPAHPSPSLFQNLPIWVASFIKSLLGLALIICDEAGEKGKALHAMGGHPGRQPTPGVGQSWGRREGEALGLMTSSITQGWPPSLGSGGWAWRKKRGCDGG